MDYTLYCGVRDAAWRILICENINSLPVSTSRLCRNMGIKIKWFQPSDNNDGFSTIIDGVPHIFVAADLFPPRARFTVAHELGHLLLGHIGDRRLVNHEPSVNDNPIECAANSFAARLLAPACVLWGCNVQNADDIMNLCDISRTAAEFRMDRMLILYNRRKFLMSPLERRVYEQFMPFVDKYCSLLNKRRMLL